MVMHQSLIEHVVALGGYLRKRDYLVGPGEITNAVKGLSLIDIGCFPDFLMLLKTCFTTSHSEWSTFDATYAKFRREYRLGTNSKVVEKPVVEKNQSKASLQRRYQLEDIKSWLYQKSDTDLIKAPFYSKFENTESREFQHLDDYEDLAELNDLIIKLLSKLASKKSRKKIKSHHRGMLDMRTLVKNRFKKGDELVELVYLNQKKERSKLVFLCDISRSMDLYSRFLEGLIRQMPKIFQDVSVSLFNTHLITLGKMDLKNNQWNKTAGMWSGGTRIGFCFDQWLKRAPDWFDRTSTILIFSDGWDTGDLDLLKSSMLRMQQMSRRIIWLNPALRSSGSREVGGMATAIPFIDILAPVYNLATLKEVVDVL